MLFKEKKRNATPPIALTVDGGDTGLLQVATIEGLFVKQRINLFSSAVTAVQLEIKRFVNESSFYVGPIGGKISAPFDCSAYLVSDNASIQADEQPRPGITQEETIRAVFQEEPAVALRTTQVDRYGNPTVGGMVSVSYDALSLATPDAVTEIYSMFKGGLSGTQVATLTIVYTSGTKETISTAEVTYP